MNRQAAWPLVLIPLVLTAIPIAAATTPDAPAMTEARSDYLENCAGCHGVGGSSAPAKVPELKNRIGWFLCTREGRDYLVRLPNVAHAPIADPAALAALLNYVVFDLGGSSTPADAQPYRGEEVAILRRSPIVRASLVRERARLVTQIRRRCPAAPASLAGYDSETAAVKE